MTDTASEDSDGRTAAKERGEELLEQWGRRAGHFLSTAAARVREEAEDIWAEAQSVKRGERD